MIMEAAKRQDEAIRAVQESQEVMAQIQSQMTTGSYKVSEKEIPTARAIIKEGKD